MNKNKIEYLQDLVNKETEIKNEKEKFLFEYINSLSKTVSEWKKLLPKKEFEKIYYDYWKTSVGFYHGRDYFTWNKKETIDKDFKNSLDSLKDDETFFMAENDTFFILRDSKDVRRPSSTRNSSYSMNINVDKNILLYEFDLQYYDGYRSHVGGGKQEFCVDLKTDKISSYYSDIKTNNSIF